MNNYQNIVLTIGYPNEKISGYAETEIPSAIPETLRSYYLKVGRMELNTAHNKLYLPSDLQEKDGYIIFMRENQGVVYWAYKEDTRDNNPEVYQYISYEEGFEWQAEKKSLDDFLAKMIYFQTVMGGFEYCGTLDDAAKVKEVEQAWSLSPISFDGMRFLANDGVIVMSFDNEDNIDVYVAVHEEQLLRKFESEFNVELDLLLFW